MRTFFRVTGLVMAIIIVLAIGLSLFISSYFKGERLKAMIIPKIEQATGRKASLGNIQISLVKGGVVVSDMALAREHGTGNFLSAKEMVLKYRFWPLLKKRLIISSISIDSPYIFIERRKDGSFNFSDLKERSKAVKPGTAEKKGKTVFLVAVQEIRLNNAKADFIDETGALPQAKADADMDFHLSQPSLQKPAGQTGAAGMPGISGEIDLKSLKTLFRNIHSNFFGKIKIAQGINLALEADIEQDRIKIKGSAVNYPKAPVIDLDMTSQRLDLGRLLSLMPTKEKGLKAKGRAKPARTPAPNVSAKGRIIVATGLYKDYIIKDLNVDWRYFRGAIFVKPFRAGIIGGQKVIVQGAMSGSLGFGKLGVQSTLNGTGQARFSKLMVRQSPIASQIAVLLGMPELSAPSFTGSLMDYVIKDGNTAITGHLDSASLEFNPVKGTIGLNKTLNIAVDLKLSPALSSRIGKKYLNFLTDQRGWTVVPLKITGSTQKPKVGISTARVGKALEKSIGGEIQKQFKKIFK
ncbi:MAG: AsmA family protein [Nitrospiraceae bacterium]|nr:AsmA family protein [Nitrospiraceae bacterium]